MGERARRVDRARTIVDDYVTTRERRGVVDVVPSTAQRKEGIVHLIADLVALADELALKRTALDRLVAWHVAVDVADDAGASGRANTIHLLLTMHGFSTAEAAAAYDASIWA